jgi:hypothetical protein
MKKGRGGDTGNTAAKEVFFEFMQIKNSSGEKRRLP